MDAVAGNALYQAATLVLRAESNTASSTSSATASATSKPPGIAGPTRPPVYKTIGIILAVCSGLFIGSSFVLKKIGLLKANAKYNEEAGEGYGYLKNVWWWSGMTLMIVGEICNFVAYAFTDAILVTPLGALSVVITAILSSIFLKERLSFVGKIGCFVCIVGSIVIPLNAPTESAVADIQEMQHYVITPGFLSYAGVIILGCLFIIFWVAPRYGKKTMMVYLSVCSLIGGLSVVCTQGLGSAIVAQANGEAQFNKWFTYVLFVFVVCTLLTEIIYLNKALNLFNAALVTPTYYVYFTSSTIVTSAVLFQGFHGTAVQIIDVILGFLTICSGVVLLQLSKSAKDVPDTAVFTGDLDQVRTVAEQAESEYEPRADALRGGAGIVRAMSTTRTKRQMEEAKRVQEERMQPIGENDDFQWDGIRRRRTVSTVSGGTGSIVRRKTLHPPLGMSQFPDDVSEPDSEVHPGFFGRIGRDRSKSTATDMPQREHSPVPLQKVFPNKTFAEGTTDSRTESPHGTAEHIYGLPEGLHKNNHDEDTEYKPPSRTIHFAETDGVNERERASSKASSLAPPRPPPHAHGGQTGSRRQFSFQSVFNRHRSESAATDDSATRPVSRGALSFTSRRSGAGGAKATEEERLGLVQGDSATKTTRYSNLNEELENTSEGWQSEPSSPEKRRGRGDDDDEGEDFLARDRQRREKAYYADRQRDEPRDHRDDEYEQINADDDDDSALYGAPLHSPTSKGGGRAFV